MHNLGTSHLQMGRPQVLHVVSQLWGSVDPRGVLTGGEAVVEFWTAAASLNGVLGRAWEQRGGPCVASEVSSADL